MIISVVFVSMMVVFRNSLLFCCKAEKAARKDLFGDDHR